MQVLRNPEFLQQTVISVILTVLLTLAGLWVSPLCAGLLAAGGMILTGSRCYFTWRRYLKLWQLSAELDRMLHGGRDWQLSRYQEGELSILVNEIQKLVCEGEQLLDRIDWLVNALLKISKIDAATVRFAQERTDAKELIEKALEPLRIPMELREQTVFCEVKEGAGFVGDASWSMEALGNILKNCMEHVGHGGTIWIRAEENQLYTEFRIEDSGPGIASEDLPHLFERFYKGKGAADSSVGIGLALARMIISAQNGTVKAENRPEGGARFVVRFYKGIV